jgi:hypothetical protein
VEKTAINHKYWRLIMNNSPKKQTGGKSHQERRANPYDINSFKEHEVGIEIGEEGFKVCDEDDGICPIEGVSTLDEAERLQAIMSGESEDRRDR